MQWSEILPGVYEVETDLSESLWRLCLDELIECSDRSPDHYLTMPDLGTESINVRGPACAQVSKYFQSDHWLQQMVELCSANDAWCTNWARPSLSWFRRHTQQHHIWHKAPMNYTSHQWHVDCLRTVLHGMIYVTPENDPKASTLFLDGDNELAITTGWNKGWIILQAGNQPHRGINCSRSPRYTFKFGISLNLD